MLASSQLIGFLFLIVGTAGSRSISNSAFFSLSRGDQLTILKRFKGVESKSERRIPPIAFLALIALVIPWARMAGVFVLLVFFLLYVTRYNVRVARELQVLELPPEYIARRRMSEFVHLSGIGVFVVLFVWGSLFAT